MFVCCRELNAQTIWNKCHYKDRYCTKISGFSFLYFIIKIKPDETYTSQEKLGQDWRPTFLI